MVVFHVEGMRNRATIFFYGVHLCINYGPLLMAYWVLIGWRLAQWRKKLGCGNKSAVRRGMLASSPVLFTSLRILGTLSIFWLICKYFVPMFTPSWCLWLNHIILFWSLKKFIVPLASHVWKLKNSLEKSEKRKKGTCTSEHGSAGKSPFCIAFIKLQNMISTQ